jgi:transposase-like protein
MGEAVFVCRQTMTATAPRFHGTAQFELGGSPVIAKGKGRFISFDFPITCPNCQDTPVRVVKNGHETSIKGNPQKYLCKDCGSQFMAHTSYFWQEQKISFISDLITKYYSEHRSLKSLSLEYHVSTAGLSRLLDAFWQTFLEESLELELLEREWSGLSTAECGQILSVWIDETFIKIQGETWYLITAVNSQGLPIHHQLAKNRFEEVIWSFWEVLMKKCPFIKLIVTDGFLAYGKACKKMQQRVLHVQHVHKGDHSRVKATIHEYDAEKGLHRMYQVGMRTNTLLEEESNTIRYLETTSKEKQVKRPRGRPRGRKDSKPRKKKNAAGNTDKSGRQKEEKPVKKRGPKDVFTNGRLYAIDPFLDQLGFAVIPLESSASDDLETNRDSIKVLEIFLAVLEEFRGIHVTSNRIENKFSCLDAWQTTRGRKTPRTVDRNVTLFFNRSSWIPRLQGIVKRMKYRMSSLPCIKTYLSCSTFQSIQSGNFSADFNLE